MASTDGAPLYGSSADGDRPEPTARRCGTSNQTGLSGCLVLRRWRDDKTRPLNMFTQHVPFCKAIRYCAAGMSLPTGVCCRYLGVGRPRAFVLTLRCKNLERTCRCSEQRGPRPHGSSLTVVKSSIAKSLVQVEPGTVTVRGGAQRRSGVRRAVVGISRFALGIWCLAPTHAKICDPCKDMYSLRHAPMSCRISDSWCLRGPAREAASVRGVQQLAHSCPDRGLWANHRCLVSGTWTLRCAAEGLASLVQSMGKVAGPAQGIRWVNGREPVLRPWAPRRDVAAA